LRARCRDVVQIHSRNEPADHRCPTGGTNTQGPDGHVSIAPDTASEQGDGLQADPFLVARWIPGERERGTALGDDLRSRSPSRRTRRKARSARPLRLGVDDARTIVSQFRVQLVAASVEGEATNRPHALPDQLLGLMASGLSLGTWGSPRPHPSFTPSLHGGSLADSSPDRARLRPPTNPLIGMSGWFRVRRPGTGGATPRAARTGGPGAGVPVSLKCASARDARGASTPATRPAGMAPARAGP